MSVKWQIIAIAVAMLIGVAACGGETSGPTTVIPPTLIVDGGEYVLGEFEKIDKVTHGPEIVETVRVLNCDNPAERSDSITEVKSIARKVQTEVVGEVGGSVDVSAVVASASVETKIASGYTLAVDDKMSRGREIELAVLPNSSVEYDIVWNPVLWHGFLPISLQSGEARIKYIYQQVAFGEVGAFRDRTAEDCGVTAGSTDEPEPIMEQEAAEMAADEAVEPETTPEQQGEEASSEPAPFAEPTVTPAPVATLTPVTIDPATEEIFIERIVYTCYDGKNDQICIMDTDGANQSQLTDTNSQNNSPVISLRGDQIAFSSNRDGAYAVYTMNSDGSEPMRISPEVGQGYYPEYSPDGSRIVYSYVIDEDSDLMIRKIEGSSTLVEIGLDASITSAVWSADGLEIAFVTFNDTDGSSQYYVMKTDDFDIQQIEVGVEDGGSRIDLSPDGKLLAIDAGESGNRDVHLVAIDGSEQIRLTEKGDNLSPTFSGDGEWIAFTSYRDGGGKIYKMRIDGTEVTQLTWNSTTDYQPRWGH